MSEKVTKFYFDLKAFRGVKTITSSIGGYYQNTYYMLRYLAYVLGKEEFKTKKYVDKPIFAPPELDYEGDPPPWKKGVYDFAED